MLNAEEVRRASERVSDLMGDRKPDWGTLPWLVDRCLTAAGGGIGLAAEDDLDVGVDELVALGALLVHLGDERAVELATEEIYGGG